MPSELAVLYCPTCRRDCLAEAPPCPDGHGERCPDRACVDCGTALLLDAPLFDAAGLDAAGLDNAGLDTAGLDTARARPIRARGRSRHAA